MRALWSPLLALAALALSPVPGWASGGHGHCDEPVPAPAVSGPAVEVAMTAAPGPCGECPAADCARHLHCSVGSATVSLEGACAPSAPVPAESAGMPAPASPVASFDPAPPTPPPNLRTR